MQERMSAGFIKLHPGPLPVHVFTRCEDIWFHDHPFSFISHVVAGSYVEEILVANPDGSYRVETRTRLPGTSHQVEATTIHRLIELPDGFCVTRVEYGPSVQTPGFYELRDGELYHRYWHETEWRLRESKFFC